MRSILLGVAAALALSLTGGPGTVTATPAPPPADELAAATATAVGIGCSSTTACTTAAGGAYLRTWRNSCSAGLPVRQRRTGRWYVLTAGHCVARAAGATWRQSGRVLGRGTRWQYGGLGTDGRAGRGDVGLIRVTGGALRPRSRVLVLGARGARLQPVTGIRTARAGERVCVTAGRTNRTRCGTVVAPDVSARYASPGLPARTVTGLAVVKGVCLQPGDSGSAVFAGRRAVGVAVARSGRGCYFWYARIAAPLARYGLAVG